MSGLYVGGWSLSSCPDSGTKDSNVEDGASRRRFSRLLGEGMLTGEHLLARVQKHRTLAKTRSLEVGAEEAEGPCTTLPEEQGTAFEQYVAVMRDALREYIAPLLVIPRAKLQRVEVPFFRPILPKGLQIFLLTFEERSMVMMLGR